MSTKKKDDLDRWLEEEYAKDPGMEARVDALVTEMALEQDMVALRDAAGVSQRELAKRLGVSQPMIAKLESGTVKNVGIVTLTRYATALGGRVKIEISMPRLRTGSRIISTRAPGRTLRSVYAKRITSKKKKSNVVRMEGRVIAAGKQRLG